MRKIITLLIAGLLLTNFAAAQKTVAIYDAPNDFVTANDLGIKDPWIYPDNPIYFLKGWGEAIDLTLTFNKSKKAEKNFKYASERLLETRKLLQDRINAEAGKSRNQVDKKLIETLANYNGKVDAAFNKSYWQDKNFAKAERVVDAFDYRNFQQVKLFNQLDDAEGLNLSEDIYKEILNAKLQVINKYEDRINDAQNVEERMEKLAAKLAQEKYDQQNYGEIEDLVVFHELSNNFNYDVIAQAEIVSEKINNKLTQKLKKIESEDDKDQFFNFVNELRASKPAFIKTLDSISYGKANVGPFLDPLSEVRDLHMERFEDQLKKMVDKKLQDQVLSPLAEGNIENLRILQDMNNNFGDPTLVSYINTKRTQTLERTMYKIYDIDTQEERENFILKAGRIPSARDFEALELITQEASKSGNNLDIELLNKIKKQAFNIVDQALADAANSQDKENLIDKIAGNDPEQILVLNNLIPQLPQSSQANLKLIMDQQIVSVEQRLKNSEDLKEILELRDRLDGNSEIKKIILEKNPEIIKNINDYQINKVISMFEDEDDPIAIFEFVAQSENLLDQYPEIEANMKELNPDYLEKYTQAQIQKINQIIINTDSAEELAEIGTKLNQYKEIGNVDQKIINSYQLQLEEKQRANLIEEMKKNLRNQAIKDSGINVSDLESNLTDYLQGYEFTGDYVNDQQNIQTEVEKLIDEKRKQAEEEIKKYLEQNKAPSASEFEQTKTEQEVEDIQQEYIDETLENIDTSQPISEQEQQQIAEEAAKQAEAEAAQKAAEEAAKQAEAEAAQKAAEEAAKQAAEEAAQPTQQEGQQSGQVPTQDQIDCSQYNFPPSCGFISDAYQRQICEVCQ